MKKNLTLLAALIFLVIICAYFFPTTTKHTNPLLQINKGAICPQGMEELLREPFNDSTIIQCYNTANLASDIPLQTIVAYKDGNEVWRWSEDNRLTNKIEIVDINNDEIKEFLLISGDYGGTCTGSWQTYQIIDAYFQVIAEGGLNSNMVGYCDDDKYEAYVKHGGTPAAESYLKLRLEKIMNDFTSAKSQNCKRLSKEFPLKVYCESNRNHGASYDEAFKVNTAAKPKVGNSLSDETITDLFVCYAGKSGEKVKITKNRGIYNCEWEHGSFWIELIAPGDVNGDGYEDAIVQTGSCGASCGISLWAVLQKNDGTGEKINLDAEKIIMSSAARTGIKDITVKNGVISIKGSGFEDAQEWDNEETKHFILDGHLLTEVDS